MQNHFSLCPFVVFLQIDYAVVFAYAGLIVVDYAQQFSAFSSSAAVETPSVSFFYS